MHFWAPAHLLLVNLLSRAVICNYPHNRGLVNTPHPHCTNTLGLFTLILPFLLSPPVHSKIPLLDHYRNIQLPEMYGTTVSQEGRGYSRTQAVFSDVKPSDIHNILFVLTGSPYRVHVVVFTSCQLLELFKFCSFTNLCTVILIC